MKKKKDIIEVLSLIWIFTALADGVLFGVLNNGSDKGLLFFAIAMITFIILWAEIRDIKQQEALTEDA